MASSPEALNSSEPTDSRANDSTPPKSSASAQIDVTDVTTQATALPRNQPRRLRELRKKSSRHEVGDVQPTTHDHIGSKGSLHGNAQKTSRRSKDGWNLGLLTHALQPFLPCKEYIKLYADNDQPRVVSLLNYYVGFVGPNFVWRHWTITSGSVEQFSRTFLQTSLHEPAFLEILLAICQADFDFRCHGQYKPSRSVLAHRSRSLKLFHHKLARMKSEHDEAVLATMCGMLTFDMTIKDWSSFKVHLQYLRRIMKTVEDGSWLGFQGWFMFDHSWAELIWASQSASVAMSEASDRALHEDEDHSAKGLSVEITAFSTRLPDGFRDLALTGLLTQRLVVLLIEVSDWLKRCTEASANIWAVSRLDIDGMRLAAKAARAIGANPRDHASALLCMALISFITSHFEDGSGHSRGLEYLTAHISLTGTGRLGTECCIWTALTIAAANETVPFDLVNRWTLSDDLVLSGQIPSTWDKVLAITQKFFCNARHVERWKKCWEIAQQRNSSTTE